jgi:hypothetical protein
MSPREEIDELLLMTAKIAQAQIEVNNILHFCTILVADKRIKVLTPKKHDEAGSGFRQRGSRFAHARKSPQVAGICGPFPFSGRLAELTFPQPPTPCLQSWNIFR